MGVFEKIAPKEDYVPKVGSTQQHLPFKSIHDDLVFLKDGGAAMVLQTSAVNFDLLSENEQIAIISSFAALLNSLSFSIQIVIRSKRLDISEYVSHIKTVEATQSNELLKHMTERYRVFVENLTAENEVLDKQFYVVLSVSSLEIGLSADLEKDLKKTLNVLVPRRDHIIKQLARIGLKSVQLDNEKLVKLFYDIYNGTLNDQDIRAFIDKKIMEQNHTLSNTKEPPKLNQAAQKAVPVPSSTPPRAVAPPPLPQEVPAQQVQQPEPTTQTSPEDPNQVLAKQNIPLPTFTDIELYPHQGNQQTENNNQQPQTFMGAYTPLFKSENIYSNDESNDSEIPTRQSIPYSVEELNKE